jgi:CRISPR-associated Cas5-like protein
VQIAQEKYLWSNSIGKYTHEKYAVTLHISHITAIIGLVANG